MVITKPANEDARIIALDKYAILDTEPEESFDELTLLASYVCKTPIALISLVDEDRQWFKSRVGLAASETSREKDGYALGTLCVVDRSPRDLAPDQKEALKALSRLVLAQLEFRRNLILLKEALSDRSKEEHERQRELVHVQETLMRVLGLRQPPKSASAI